MAILNRLTNTKITEINPNDLIIFLQIPNSGGLAYSNTLNIVYGDEYKWTTGDELRRIVNAGSHKVFAGNLDLRNQFYKAIQIPFTHITLIRHPVERLVSLYYSLQEDVNNPNHEVAMSFSLEEICNKPEFFHIFQPWQLISTLSSVQPGNRPCNAVQQTKFNLANFFTFIGLTENYDEFVGLSAKILGWPKDLDYSPLNSIHYGPDVDSLPKRTLDAIGTYLDRDIQIYNFAKDLYETQVEPFRPIQISVPKGITKVISGKLITNKPRLRTRVWEKIKKILFYKIF